jgi:hypothetical protein
MFDLFMALHEMRLRLPVGYYSTVGNLKPTLVSITNGVVSLMTEVAKASMAIMRVVCSTIPKVFTTRCLVFCECA